MNLTAKSSENTITPLRRVALLIPNALSFVRLGLGLWFPWVPAEWRIGVVIVGAATDMLDGTLSRALRATTVTGRIVDPIADKLFVLSVLGTLLFQGAVPAWQAGLVAFRDLAVLAGVVGVVLKHGIMAVKEMPPSLLGKSATAAQFAFFVSVLYFGRVPVVAFAAAAVLSVLAGADYLRRYLKGSAAAAVMLACAIANNRWPCSVVALPRLSARDRLPDERFRAAVPRPRPTRQDARRKTENERLKRVQNFSSFVVLRLSPFVPFRSPQSAPSESSQPITEHTPESNAIAFLGREVPGWPKQNRCFSCHNNGDGARALFVALRLKHRVSSDWLDSTTEWLAKPEAWDQAEGDAAFKDKRLARLQFAAALAAAVRSGQIHDRSPLRRAAELVATDQEADGSWHVEPAGTVGAPATYGRPLATVIALATLRVADADQFHVQIAKARRWLEELPARNVPEAAAVLFDPRGVQDLETRDQARRSLEFLVRSQTDDGGWGPFVNAPPENFDTAVALIALVTFAERPNVRQIIARGRAYLIEQQRPDGSWTETTRPPGATSYAQRISTTAWATIALLGTSDVKSE